MNRLSNKALEPIANAPTQLSVSQVIANNFSRESGRDLNPFRWVLKGFKRVKHGGIRLFTRTFTSATGVRIPLGTPTLLSIFRLRSHQINKYKRYLMSILIIL